MASTDPRRSVGGCDRGELVEGMKPQVGAVRRALATHEEWRDDPVTAALASLQNRRAAERPSFG
jgi:hypothetical protein